MYKMIQREIYILFSNKGFNIVTNFMKENHKFVYYFRLFKFNLIKLFYWLNIKNATEGVVQHGKETKVVYSLLLLIKLRLS